jgi:long-chain acyl-CoA synthetase
MSRTHLEQAYDSVRDVVVYVHSNRDLYYLMHANKVVDMSQCEKVSGRLKEQYKLQNGKFVSPSPIEDILQRSPFIAQAAVFGGDEEFNAALLVPDMVEIKQWADANKVTIPADRTSPEFADFLTNNEKLEKLITHELMIYSKELKAYEVVKRYVLLAEPFTPENNLLTQKMSLKRHNVSKVYADMISKIFSGEVGYEVKYSHKKE